MIYQRKKLRSETDAFFVLNNEVLKVIASCASKPCEALQSQHKME